MNTSIKTWNEDDRPREKLSNKGARSLSDSELLAIIIGSGSREESAIELSKRILSSVNYNWNELGQLNISQLCQFKGIGEAKAISIITALEIGKRRNAEVAETKVKYNTITKTYEQLKPLLLDLPHEEFWVIFADQALQEIKKEQISKGGISATVVDVRIIIKRAIELNASNIILAHNHPSGNLKPSESDIQITQKVKKSSRIIFNYSSGSYYHFQSRLL